MTWGWNHGKRRETFKIAKPFIVFSPDDGSCTSPSERVKSQWQWQSQFFFSSHRYILLLLVACLWIKTCRNCGITSGRLRWVHQALSYSFLAISVIRTSVFRMCRSCSSVIGIYKRTFSQEYKDIRWSLFCHDWRFDHIIITSQRLACLTILSHGFHMPSSSLSSSL